MWEQKNRDGWSVLKNGERIGMKGKGKVEGAITISLQKVGDDYFFLLWPCNFKFFSSGAISLGTVMCPAINNRAPYN